jgi:hypothetical protein
MFRSSLVVLAISLLTGCGGGDDSTRSSDTTTAGSLSADETGTDRLALADVIRLENEARALPDSIDQTDGAAAPPDRALQAATVPAILKAFDSWILELPVNASGQPTGDPQEIAVAAVISGNPPVPTFVGQYFKVVGSSLQFTASPYGALTSSSAGGARCELKQAKANRWNPLTQTRSMQLKQTLTSTPAGKSPDVVVGQVHDDENLVLIKYYGPVSAKGNSSDTGTMKVEFNHADPSGIMVLDSQYKVGSAFSVTIKVDKGTATVTYAKGTTTRIFSKVLKPTGGDAYFKAGVYPQKHKTGNPYTGLATVLISSATFK